MAISARFMPMARELLIDPGASLSPEAQAKAFAAFVRTDIARVDAANAEAAGSPIPHHTFVDGRETDDLESVRPDGVIVARWDLLVDVVREVYEMIRAASPVRSGRFRDSQTIYADGHAVDTPEETIGADEVVIASTVPYARKIEGMGHAKPESPKAPDGVYKAAAALAQAKFGNLARIKFSSREIVGGGTDLERWATGYVSAIMHERKRAKAKARDERQPAVILTFR